MISSYVVNIITRMYIQYAATYIIMYGDDSLQYESINVIYHYHCLQCDIYLMIITLHVIVIIVIPYNITSLTSANISPLTLDYSSY